MRLPTQLFGNSLETLESPFLDEEITNRSVAGALDASRMDGERAIDVSYEHEADATAFESPLEHLEPDDEILNGDNRVMVGDTLGSAQPMDLRHRRRDAESRLSEKRTRSYTSRRAARAC